MGGTQVEGPGDTVISMHGGASGGEAEALQTYLSSMHTFTQASQPSHVHPQDMPCAKPAPACQVRWSCCMASTDLLLFTCFPSPSIPTSEKVQGCNADLGGEDLKKYHRRNRVCAAHMKAQCVMVRGKESRYCQQVRSNTEGMIGGASNRHHIFSELTFFCPVPQVP